MIALRTSQTLIFLAGLAGATLALAVGPHVSAAAGAILSLCRSLSPLDVIGGVLLIAWVAALLSGVRLSTRAAALLIATLIIACALVAPPASAAEVSQGAAAAGSLTDQLATATVEAVIAVLLAAATWVLRHLGVWLRLRQDSEVRAYLNVAADKAIALSRQAGDQSRAWGVAYLRAAVPDALARFGLTQDAAIQNFLAAKAAVTPTVSRFDIGSGSMLLASRESGQNATVSLAALGDTARETIAKLSGGPSEASSTPTAGTGAQTAG